MWVIAQVLRHMDPNFDVIEFAREYGINTELLGDGVGAGPRLQMTSTAAPGARREHRGLARVVTAQSSTEEPQNPPIYRH